MRKLFFLLSFYAKKTDFFFPQLLVSIFWLTCCLATNAKNIRESSRGRRITATPNNSNTTLLPKTAEPDTLTMKPPVVREAVSHSAGPAVLNASLDDALKKLAELAESNTGVGVDDPEESNSTTNKLKSQSGYRDLQVAGSDLLRIEARALNGHSTGEEWKLDSFRNELRFLEILLCFFCALFSAEFRGMYSR